MFSITLILLSVLFSVGNTELISCNETVTKLRICSLVPNYEQGMPPAPLMTKGPTVVSNSITLFSLAEFNEDQSSVSLTVLIAMVWNDTRITLKSNNPDE